MLRRPEVLQNCCQRTAALNKELQQLLAEAEPLVADADAAASITNLQAKKDADDTLIARFAATDRTASSPNGDDALAERTTIPCDLCGEAVPLSSFLHHVQVSHGINLNAFVDVTPDKPGFGGAWPGVAVALDHGSVSQTPSPIVHVADGRSDDGSGGETDVRFESPASSQFPAKETPPSWQWSAHPSPEYPPGYSPVFGISSTSSLVSPALGKAAPGKAASGKKRTHIRRGRPG